MAGLFITIEGPDGAGKSTQVKLLADYLRKLGLEVILTREPGGTDLAEKIRELMLAPTGETVAPMTEVLLYAASRAQHVEGLIKPALARGAVVISDRFVDSSVAYQGFGRGLGVDEVWQINQWALGGLLPSLTIILDLELFIGRQRTAERDQKQAGGPDRLEQENLEFHQKVRDGFLSLAKQDPKRIHVVPAAGSVEQVFQSILLLVNPLLAQRKMDQQRVNDV